MSSPEIPELPPPIATFKERWEFLQAERNEFYRRLESISEIIEAVDNRCLSKPGPVPLTCDEITNYELQKIYELSKIRFKCCTP